MIRILFARHNERREEEIIQAFSQYGIHVTEYNSGNYEMKEEVHAELVKFISENIYHFVFSLNFYPVIANAAYNAGTKYVCWQYDLPEAALYSGCITFPTNYVFLNNYVWYGVLNKKGIETVYYLPFSTFVQSVGEEKGEMDADVKITLKSVLNVSEVQIIDAILKWDMYKRKKCKVAAVSNREQICNNYEEDKEYLFLLKDYVIKYINEMLAKGNIAEWEQMVALLMRNGVNDLQGYFWEFYIINIMVDIYKEERNRHYKSGEKISLLQFRNTEELLNTYFQLVFYLRRMEYDVEMENYLNVIENIKSMNVSDVFIKHVLNKGQIEDKEKVMNALRRLWQE